MRRRPDVHMNPVLLKPQSDIGAQVVVRGRALGAAEARAYHELKPRLMDAVLDSYARLSREADLVLVEGAGSPAEINLRGGDIANMGFARAADIPVALIGDIDRGGVIAQFVGTHAVVDPEDAARSWDFWSTSSAATRRCSTTAWRSSPGAPAGARWASCRTSPRPSPARRGCGGAGPSRPAGGRR